MTHLGRIFKPIQGFLYIFKASKKSPASNSTIAQVTMRGTIFQMYHQKYDQLSLHPCQIPDVMVKEITFHGGAQGLISRIANTVLLGLISIHTDLDRSFVIPMFWESLGKAIAHNLSYNHSIFFKVASFESCSILDYICMIYF